MGAKKWPLRGLGLKVLDLPRQVAYYRRLGLRLLESHASLAVLGFAEEPVLHLRQLENGRPRPRRSAGLYHFALLLPDAQSLGRFVGRCADLGLTLDGASDPLVRQATDLSATARDGIEVYHDRPPTS